MNKEIKLRFKKYIVDIKDYKILNQLDSGGFGLVCSVQNTKTGNIYAAKTIINKGNQDQYKRMINREIGIMVKCQHPTLIKFYGYSLQDFNGQPNAVIIMELSKKGSLADLLKNVKKSLADENYDNTARQIILIGIAYGMMHLHQHQIIHRDLKPGNILLDDNLHPHITDFGLSKSFEKENSKSQSQQCGTSIYMAPEAIESTHYNTKADVYSFGILMYEVVTDNVPYPLFENGKMTLFQFTNKIVHENYRPKFNFPVKKSIKKLIERCWSNNSHERPTFEEIFKMLAYNEESNDNDVFDDDDDDEQDENKYYLDDVDVDTILYYADEIQENEDQESDESSKMKELFDTLISPLIKENEELKKQFVSLKQDCDSMKEEINSLKSENLFMKAQIDSFMNSKSSDRIDNKKDKSDQIESSEAGNEDASDLKEEDIQTIMFQSNVSRSVAIKALREVNGDLVSAVMNLAL